MINSNFFQDKKKQIYNILEHAIKNVPYYKETLNLTLPKFEDFNYDFFSKNIPLLNKNIIGDFGDKFLQNGIDKSKLAVDVTSGTEGKPLLCYKLKLGRIQHARFLWKARNSFISDLKISDRFARFYAFRSDENNIFASNYYFYDKNDLYLSLLDLSPQRLEIYWDNILEFKPRWMHGPATAIYNLALYVKESGREKIIIEFVELNGEFVQEEHIKLISEVFNCKIGNHYGCREFWAIAYSCKKNHLHILDDSVYVEEVYDKESGKMELVVTTLINKAWPLIRYKIGDIGNLYKVEESCSKLSKYCIDVKKGRKADFIKLDNLQIVNAITFSAISRGISKKFGYNAILQYQVIKHSGKYLEILIRSNCNDCVNLLEVYDYELRKVISPEIYVKYTLVDFIAPDKRTGKTRDFIDLSLNK